ncbi:MAG: hypothetical protein FJ104_04940 [Deltaproteobacteria bacterium]|nr:hypothetical protein [Deltaproteobacteria bacterium]
MQIISKKFSSLSGLATVGLFAAAACSVDASDDATPIARATAALTEEGETCVVPEEVVEHACQHAQFGPFASAPAQPYPGFVFTDISPPHTAYDLTLPVAGSGFQGAVLFRPIELGDHAVFTAPGVSVALYDGGGVPVPVEREGEIAPTVCGELSRAHVFHFETTEMHTFVFGPASGSSVQAIVEHLGEQGCDGCEEVHLHAFRSVSPPDHEDGEAHLDHAIAFEVPRRIPVTEGTVSRGLAILSFSAGGGASTHCVYRGRPVPNAFRLVGCTDGHTAGSDATADTFRLRITAPAAANGPVAAELELVDEECGGHDDHDDDHDHE